jgi:tripartite-type tricarboxylate transporter receptor subunit TctC
LTEQGVPLALRADFGFFAPKGTPAADVATLNGALGKAVQSDEFKAFVAQALVEPAFLPAAEYQRVVDAERAIYAKVVPKLALENK